MSDWLWSALIDPLGEIHFQKAIIGATLSAIACGVIGCFIVLRQMAFLGDALSHSMLAGVTAGYLVMQIVFGRDADAAAMLVGAIIAGLVTVGAISFVSQATRIKNDTAIGIMYTGIFALGGILASVFSHRIHIHIYDFVVGNVLAVKDGYLWMIAIVCALVLSTIILLFRHFQLTTFDPIMAASIGIPVAAMHYLLTACTSLVVVSAVPVVGVILVVGLLVTPAATAYMICNRLRHMVFLAPLFGVSSVLLGLYLSIWIGNVATGPMIVIVSTSQFLVLLVVAPRYGLIADWLRRTRTVPQQVLEDVLGCMVREGGQPITRGMISEYVEAGADQVRRAIHALSRRGWVEVVSEGLMLTNDGRDEARRLMRAHRLWETYLQHTGMPSEALHDRAHQLEHLRDGRIVDYLDDKLGHPVQDPHGAVIPEDIDRVVPGATVRLSLLREGHRGTIQELGSHAADSLLRIGMSVAVGPRREQGNLWTLQLADDTDVTLDHSAADDVNIRLDAG